jgi:hypothetical protein
MEVLTMTYFKVLKQYDNNKRIDGSILVQNELYTKKEIDKYKIDLSKVQEIEVNKNKVYRFFGARFNF